jgi:hypothetical protein
MERASRSHATRPLNVNGYVGDGHQRSDAPEPAGSHEPAGTSPAQTLDRNGQHADSFVDIFGWAGQAEMVRSSQKDELYMSMLQEMVHESAQSIVGSRRMAKLQDALRALSHMLYFGLGIFRSAQTPGEEYCDLQLVSQHFPIASTALLEGSWEVGYSTTDLPSGITDRERYRNHTRVRKEGRVCLMEKYRTSSVPGDVSIPGFSQSIFVSTS